MSRLKLLKTHISLLLVLCLSLSPAAAQASVFGEFTISDEAELGREIHTLIQANYNVVQDPKITEYIQDIATKLEEAAPPQPFPLKVDVIEHPDMNAFATVAGYMVLFTGMILKMDNESELAAIMSHEYGHITQRHVARNIERSQKISIGSLVGVLAGVLVGAEAGQALAVGSMAGGQSAILRYSRSDEREADQVGMNYLIEAGYNPQGMVSAMQKIRRMQFFAGGDMPSYLSTHPGVDERINYLRDRVEGLDAEIREREDDNTRLRRIQTLLRARHEDPSQALNYFQTQMQDECLSQLGQGIAHSRMNRVREARENFENLLSRQDQDSLFLREAGRFYFHYDQLSKAGELLQKAIMLDPEDSMALLFYARVLAEKEDLETAVSYFQKALKQQPEDPRAHEHLARTHGRDGENFMAHLHMAYAYLYHNNQDRTEFHREKAKELAETREQKEDFQELDEAYKERLQFWKRF